MNGVTRIMVKIRRLLFAYILVCFCAGLPLFAAPARALANGKPPVASKDEDPCADLREKIAKLEAEKAAQKKKAAAAKKKTAAKKTAAKKTAAKKPAPAKKTPTKTAKKPPVKRQAVGDVARQQDAWKAGRNLVEEGRYQTAVQYLRRFLNAHQRSADGWYWLSRAHHALGDYDRAQWAANIALEIDPYYAALTKTPSGLQPLPKPTKASKKEPRPSMSVLPVKQPVPTELALVPTTISFPYLEPASGDKPMSDDTAPLMAEVDPSRSPASADADAYREAHLRYEPYPPLPRGRTVAWMQHEKFTEISRWRFRVDRMAILKDPRVPVAWKGEYPYEVYFWTGTEWARIPSKNDASRLNRAEKIDDVLLRAKDDMGAVLTKNGYAWRESDTPALASNAMDMRYWWQGEVDLGAAQKRAEERARKAASGDLTPEADAQRRAEK